MPIRCDTHMHTVLCRHAVGTPQEYVEHARRIGMKTIIFTDHTPIPGGYNHTVRMTPDEIADYRNMIRSVQNAERHRISSGKNDGVEVLYGIESDIVPDPAIAQSIIETTAGEPFDFVLGSLHFHSLEYGQWERANRLIEDAARVRAYFNLLIESVSSGQFDSYAHVDLIAMGISAPDIDPAGHRDAIMPFLEACRDAGRAIELNTSGLSKSISRCFPHRTILRWAADLGVRITIGSDAHTPERVGFRFDLAEELLREAGIPEVWVWRNRIPEPVGID